MSLLNKFEMMKIIKVCCCCLSEACYKDISNEYFYNGQKQVISALLYETFNVKIFHSRLICEKCVMRVRDAAAFRSMVEDSQAVLSGNTFQETKTEADFFDDQDDFVDHVKGEYDDVKVGVDEELRDWRVRDADDEPVDGNLMFIKVAKADVNDEPSDGKDDEVSVNDNLEGNEAPLDNVKDELVKKTVKKKKLVDEKSKKEKKLKKTLEREPPTQIQMKENSLKLINNSNLCVFESLKTRFRCFYCKNSYLTMLELRQHNTKAKHSNLTYLKMCINRLRGMSYKNVDISELKCRLCEADLIDLTALKSHLNEKHKIDFPSGEHMLIPYKLMSGFNCALCNERYNSFFRLSIHMNTHYTNNVCEICGVSYINRLSLRMHVNSVHKEQKCSICPAIFSNRYTKTKHMRKEHNSSEVKRYCLLCNKTFRYTYMLNEHKITEHGVKRQASSVCQECGKTFPSAVNLRTHIRSVHIRERNYPCSRCGMSFFTSSDQRRHEKTHLDVRSFSCSYCEGRYKSKDSLRRHTKRQHGNIIENAA